MFDNGPSSRDPMLEMFIFESTQLIEQLEELLLGTEQAGTLSGESVNEIFRIMHTIKGSAAMMAYDGITHLAHALEDLFDCIRNRPAAAVDCACLNDHVLMGIDFIKVEVAKVNEGWASDGDAEALIGSIRQFQEELVRSADSPCSRYAARIFFENGCQMENLRAFGVIRALQPLTSSLACQPDDIADNELSADVIRENGFRIYMTSCADPETLAACLEQTMFLERLELEPVARFPAGILDAEADVFAETSGASAPDDALQDQMLHQVQVQGKPQSLVSVSIQKLDQLVDLVGELVIAEAMVTRNPDLAGLALPQFERAARQLHKLTGELQDIVMSVRMVPIAAAFHKMQRLVRDMSRKLGKEVTLTLQGEETEIDKSVLDSLADPLMHLIRNALDHGIESPAERAAAGKPVQGRLSLAARADGGDVWISIRDDGRGLDRSRILEKARDRHLLTRPEHEYTEKEIFGFVLLPGFSTRDEVSEYSGRGVGMDVVRENIARIGGTLSLDSAAGAGTTVAIRIPLTLAIIDGMQIAVGDASYIIPITAIRESFRLDRQPIMTDMDGNEMLMIRGACCNVIRLHRRFGAATRVTDPHQGIMVVVEDGDRACCLFVDRLIGEQQVVVKPLPAYIQKTPGLAGCTILGDGGISLILDIGALINDGNPGI